MGKSKELTFEKEKETKNMVRFSEVVVPGESEFVRTVYLPKHFVGSNTKVKVTYEIIED